MSFLFLIFFSLNAPALQVQPTELVVDTPLDSFSERTEGLPTQTISTDTLHPDSSLFESLNQYPSLFSKGDLSGGSPSLSIRGSGDYSRTLLLYDGIPLNARDGLGANPLLISTEDLSHIQILKGPASVYYGSDAMGGAINLIPEELHQSKIRLGAGSFGKRTLLLASPVWQNDSNHLQISGFLSAIDGNFNFDQSGFTGTRSNNNSETQRVAVSGQHKLKRTLIKENLIYAQSFGTSPGPIDNSIAPTYYNRLSTLGSFLIEHSFDEASKLSYRASNVEAENFNQISGVTTRWYSNELLQTFSFERKFEDALSSELFVDNFNNTFENKPAVSKLTDTRFEPGFIIKYAPDAQYLVSPGLRYLPNDGKFVKSVIVSQESLGLRNWLSYAESFRSPNFTQKYWNDSTFVGNPNLTAEQSYQIEAGLSRKPNPAAEGLFNKVGFEASVYSTRYDNYIQFVTGAPSTYQNAGGANIFGVDAETGINYKIWSFSLSYSYMTAQLTQTPTNMTLAPTNRASFLLGAQLGPLVTEIQNTYWDKYYVSATQTVDPWIVTDLTFRTLGLAEWVVKAGVLNILDVKRIYTALYPEPGRNFYVNLEKAF